MHYKRKSRCYLCPIRIKLHGLKIPTFLCFFSIFIIYPVNKSLAKNSEFINNGMNNDNSMTLSIDEDMLKRTDYKNCVIAAMKTPNGTKYFSDYSVREWKSMCAGLKSDLGKEMRGSCYSQGETPRTLKERFCFNFNH